MAYETYEHIRDYEKLEQLGAGGMGRVYKVRNLFTNRIEAMKVLRRDVALPPEMEERFKREIKILAGLSHPNIASLYTAFPFDGQLAMIIEYVEGKTLANRLREGSLSAYEALGHVDQMLDALSYAHSRRVIHRDIKPENMIIGPTGAIKLMDFGIARAGDECALTRAGTTMGSLPYMSPEQIRAETVDERSDLYSLGVCLYEMVTGRLPYQGDSYFSFVQAHLHHTPISPCDLVPSLPPGVNELILTSIAKNAGQRFESANAFRLAVGELRSELQQPPRLTTRETSTSFGTVLKSEPTEALVLSATAWRHWGFYMFFGAIVVIVAVMLSSFNWPRAGRVRASERFADSQKVVRPTISSAGNANTQARVSASLGTKGGAIERSQAESTTPSPSTVRPTVRQNTLTEMNRPAVPASLTTKLTRPDEGDLEQQMDNLLSHAVAINEQLDTLRQQLTTQGLGSLREEIAVGQEQMKKHLAEAQKAFLRGDTQGLKKHLDLAAQDISKLDAFLGSSPDSSQ